MRFLSLVLRRNHDVSATNHRQSHRNLRRKSWIIGEVWSGERRRLWIAIVIVVRPTQKATTGTLGLADVRTDTVALEALAQSFELIFWRNTPHLIKKIKHNANQGSWWTVHFSLWWWWSNYRLNCTQNLWSLRVKGLSRGTTDKLIKLVLLLLALRVSYTCFSLLFSLLFLNLCLFRNHVVWWNCRWVCVNSTAGTTTETEEATSFNKIDDMSTWGCRAWKAQPAVFFSFFFNC